MSIVNTVCPFSLHSAQWKRFIDEHEDIIDTEWIDRVVRVATGCQEGDDLEAVKKVLQEALKEKKSGRYDDVHACVEILCSNHDTILDYFFWDEAEEEKNKAEYENKQIDTLNEASIFEQEELKQDSPSSKSSKPRLNRPKLELLFKGMTSPCREHCHCLSVSIILTRLSTLYSESLTYLLLTTQSLANTLTNPFKDNSTNDACPSWENIVKQLMYLPAPGSYILRNWSLQRCSKGCLRIMLGLYTLLDSVLKLCSLCCPALDCSPWEKVLWNPCTYIILVRIALQLYPYC